MDPDRGHHYLHFTSPATSWSQALPLGNGRLGCMVHGRTSAELLQLNEDSVWYGGPQDRTPRSAKWLPRLRRLIRDGRHREAEQLARDEFFASPNSMRHYEPLGSAYLDFEFGEKAQITGYQRWLDIGKSMSTVVYQVNGINVKREVIASYPDDVLVLRVTSSQAIRFTVRLNRRSENEWDTNEFLDSVRTEVDDALEIARILIQATPGGRDSSRLSCVLGVRCSDELGAVEAAGTCLTVKSTDCLVAIGAHTAYRHADPESVASSDVSNALRRSWQELVSRHTTDYRSLFGRTRLRLRPDDSQTPTDIRIAERNREDSGLVALYHNYGRYLLISSSRDGPMAIPANLQGIWNPSFSPPWGSKFTININTQMNYWPAMPSNLIECALPLVDLLERMAHRGRRTAQLMYQCSGWCAHHNTDIWADTDPQDAWMPSTLWPLGGVWLCIDAVQMMQYRYDEGLHKRLFPVLEGCIEFLRDFLIPSADGNYLVASPSLSPENTFVSETGEPGIFCEGSAIDMTIIETAFELYLWSIDILRIPSSLKEKVEAMMTIIPPLRINTEGLVQEWGMQDYKEHEPGHRHVSHLFGLYPGSSISMINSPELANAAKRVLERRASHGGGHTGWSRAWLLNMHARLQDAEGCGNHMELLLENSTLPNLLDNHPPFQIDGNFGGCTGIIECLLQSSERRQSQCRTQFSIVIRLLPACPKEWAKGQLSGVCVRGGWSVSFEWEAGRVVDRVRVCATQQTHTRAQVVFPDETTVLVQGFGEHEVSRKSANDTH
ncbi:alpha-L-fucosidase [Xylariales sp. AK1849]|nr:alpha-L-fucosidase [Xylariales sp. AK1849]